MPAQLVYPHIQKHTGEPARLERIPRIRVSQIVLDYLEYGWSADEIHRQHPHLTLAEIHAAFAYYFDHHEEIEAEIEAEWEESQKAARQAKPPPFAARLRASKRR